MKFIMKKFMALATVVACVALSDAKAQNVNGVRLSDIPADYMEVKCFYDGGDKYISRLDYGQVIKRGKDSNIRDDDGKDLLFNSPIDCINKLKNYGYELFQTYSKQNGKDDSIAVYVLKRK